MKETFNSGDIAENRRNYISVIEAKTSVINECKHHRTISLMRHMRTFIIRILINGTAGSVCKNNETLLTSLQTDISYP